MGIKLKGIDAIVYTTLLLALLGLFIALCLQHLAEGLALFAGASWGALNLYFLKSLLYNLLLRSEQKLRLLLSICIKWPLLYFVGYCLLKTAYLPSLYLLIGFSLTIATIFIVASVGVIKKI